MDNDGVHPSQEASGEGELAAGFHDLKVWYFQGPAQSIAIQLFVTPPGGEERIFRMSDFSAGLAAAAGKLHAEATADGIRVRMDAAILFDTNKAELKLAARDTILAVAQLIRSYPSSTVRVEGHTDATGEDGFNQKLSEARAGSVKAALAAASVPAGVKFLVQGYGQHRPVADNGSEAGRAQNRRVEIYIKP